MIKWVNVQQAYKETTDPQGLRLFTSFSWYLTKTSIYSWFFFFFLAWKTLKPSHLLIRVLLISNSVSEKSQHWLRRAGKEETLPSARPSSIHSSPPSQPFVLWTFSSNSTRDPWSPKLWLSGAVPLRAESIIPNSDRSAKAHWKKKIPILFHISPVSYCFRSSS